MKKTELTILEHELRETEIFYSTINVNGMSSFEKGQLGDRKEKHLQEIKSKINRLKDDNSGVNK